MSQRKQNCSIIISDKIPDKDACLWHEDAADAAAGLASLAIPLAAAPLNPSDVGGEPPGELGGVQLALDEVLRLHPAEDHVGDRAGQGDAAAHVLEHRQENPGVRLPQLLDRLVAEVFPHVKAATLLVQHLLPQELAEDVQEELAQEEVGVVGQQGNPHHQEVPLLVHLHAPGGLALDVIPAAVLLLPQPEAQPRLPAQVLLHQLLEGPQIQIVLARNAVAPAHPHLPEMIFQIIPYRDGKVTTPPAWGNEGRWRSFRRKGTVHFEEAVVFVSWRALPSSSIQQ